MAERRYQPGVIAAGSFGLSPRTELLLNIGAIRASESKRRFTQVFVASSLRTDLSDKMNVFAKIYALNKESAGGPTQKFVAAGAVYYLNARTALDARLGLGLNNQNGGPDYLCSAGISRLF